LTPPRAAPHRSCCAKALAPDGRVHRSPAVGGASTAEEEGGSGEEASGKNDEEEERLEELEGEASRRRPSPVVVGSSADCRPGRPRGLVVTAPSSSSPSPPSPPSSSSSPPPCSWGVVRERERERERERVEGKRQRERASEWRGREGDKAVVLFRRHGTPFSSFFYFSIQVVRIH
jgi:hypothetical protein